MKKEVNVFAGSTNRRTFLKKGTVAAGAATVGAGLLGAGPSAFGQLGSNAGPPITKGDIAILTFLSALEQVEADLWIQYAELGGATNQGLSPIDLELNGQKIDTGLAPNYITALEVLDGDMPQYIVDNTDDEISHHRFLNNYLASKGAKPIDLSSFAILPPSQVTGVPQKGRLTNLKQLTVDTSWWTRYRSTIPNPLQAIASTAGFHFGFIEQGGTSLYPTLAQKVTNLEVLRVLLSIGPSETMHFQVWHDKAGNAPAITDGNLTFPNLNSGVDPNNGATGAAVADEFQTNLIMPEPTIFLNSKFGPVSIIRPTAEPNGGAMAAVQSFVDDGLFLDPATGSNTGIVAVLRRLAEEADEARRQL